MGGRRTEEINDMKVASWNVHLPRKPHPEEVRPERRVQLKKTTRKASDASHLRQLPSNDCGLDPPATRVSSER